MARLVLLMLACASIAVFVAAESKDSISVNGVTMPVDQLSALNSPLADALLKAHGAAPKVAVADASYVKRHGKKSKNGDDYKKSENTEEYKKSEEYDKPEEDKKTEEYKYEGKYEYVGKHAEEKKNDGKYAAEHKYEDDKYPGKYEDKEYHGKTEYYGGKPGYEREETYGGKPGYDREEYYAGKPGYAKEYYGDRGYYGEPGYGYGPEYEYGYDDYRSPYGGYHESHKFMCLLEKDGGRLFEAPNTMTSRLTCCDGPHGSEYEPESPVKDYYENHPDHKFLTTDGKLKTGLDQIDVGECTWKWDLNDKTKCPVKTDDGVTCEGLATATCVISNPVCGDPLCKGLTIEFKGVINSMYAKVKTPKPRPPLAALIQSEAPDGSYPEDNKPHTTCGKVYVAHGTITNTVTEASLITHSFPWDQGSMEFIGLFVSLDNSITIPENGTPGKRTLAKSSVPANAAPVEDPCTIAHAPLVHVGEYKILFTK